MRLNRRILGASILTTLCLGGVAATAGASALRPHPDVSVATSGSVSAASNSSGAQFAFWKGADGNLWDATSNGTAWTEASMVPGMGPLGSEPTAVSLNGSEDVFWQGADNNLWEAVFNGTSWTGPTNLGMGPLGSAPSATGWGNQVDVFWKGMNGELWEAFTSGTSWAGPLSPGMGPLGSAPTASSSPAGATRGQQYVFWMGADAN